MKLLLQLLLCSFLLLTSVIGNSANRLNIVIIVGDDWGGPYASAYTGIYGRASASDIIQTPNIDRIAKNGVLFKNAYVNAPSCTAARSSIFSGRYFFNTNGGALLNGNWDFSIPTFPVLLRNAGYHVGFTYKAWSPGKPPNAPFGGISPLSYAYGKGEAPNHFSSHVTKMVAEGQPLDVAKTELFNQVRGSFEAFLAKRQPNQPFLYWFGPTNTHRVWEKGSGKALWGINPDDLKGKLPSFIPDVPEAREDMADYLGEIKALDAFVGILLKKLEKIGELDNTLIVATGDNGPGGFPHGKVNLYDYGVSTPLVMWMPHTRGGRVVTDFTTLMDLTPTFLEVAGVPIPPKVNGRSLVNILQATKSGQVDLSRFFAITGMERHGPYEREDALGYPSRALRTKDFLYIHNFAPERWPVTCPITIMPPNGHHLEPFGGRLRTSPTMNWIVMNRDNPDNAKYYTWTFSKRPKEELYDLRSDPEQLNNVASNIAYASHKVSLRNQLLTILKKVGDPRVIGDGGTFDRPPYVYPLNITCEDISFDWVPPVASSVIH